MNRAIVDALIYAFIGALWSLAAGQRFAAAEVTVGLVDACVALVCFAYFAWAIRSARTGRWRR